MAAAFLLLCSATAQRGTHRRITLFDKFQPAIIQMERGNAVTVTQANIFLKNSTLLYKEAQGHILQARRERIKSVVIAGHYFERIDTLLAERLDTVGANAVFRVMLIDQEALDRFVENNRVVTDMSLQDYTGATTVELFSEDEIEYPVISLYFVRYNGKVVRAHERELKRLITKDQRRAFTTVIQSDNFSWNNPESLSRMLKALSPTE